MNFLLENDKIVLFGLLLAKLEVKYVNLYSKVRTFVPKCCCVFTVDH